MNPERWQRIEELFHEALNRAPEARAAFLTQACQGDVELRKEVESLLAQNSGSIENVTRADPEMIGQTISHYHIVEKLGQGGMGVVYKAQDLSLRRPVALKFLAVPAEQFRTRLLIEAKAAAALNHPNICTIYEVDEERLFLAMEFVDGETIAQKIKTGPLALDAAIEITVQAGQGLQAAHDKGIVHRDIKSSNIVITPKGQVKILDFGLALVEEQTRITHAGAVLGTPAYMSPEQASAKAVDHRTDIWSLAVVLYEMVSGQ